MLKTHFSPGMSNRFVSPVQLMSSFYKKGEHEYRVFNKYSAKILQHSQACG